jgi:hypothetical protein
MDSSAQRPWLFRDLIRPALPQKLPVVLSVDVQFRLDSSRRECW